MLLKLQWIYLLCLCPIHLFQGIFHWFFPIPGLLEDVRKEQEEAEKEALEKAEENNAVIENTAEEIKEEKEKPE